ncbi:sarcosine oxidase subunit delta [Mesorhizobium erdmanii]|uniref:sarcosine oxidase subunit delta n=1 Tax=Mesorhizobium erdmanii TaxID=1777866 RepID=UPI00047CCC07|nr:sarcosine oxidase subunit delta [Mesorhizobium erdmanii]
MRISCPFCGERDHSEFTYGGDASVTFPELDASLEEWNDAVYIRSNPKGVLREKWQHSGGCRIWLVLERDTLTHSISQVEPVRLTISELVK